MREACSSEKSARSRLGACRERARRSGAGRLVINGGFPVARDLQAGVPVADHEVASAAKATMAARHRRKLVHLWGCMAALSPTMKHDTGPQRLPKRPESL